MLIERDESIRELDHRTTDRTQVSLLWNPGTNRVTVAVEDERSGEAFEFGVDAAQALAAFHHPYAYASRDHGAHALTA
jgi:hypothetical protein